ncbi:hypothetical protein SS1G_07963 [Sclerotinia sclerotiorum 1980 UF-70]|uniref:Uncharacterized protein n=2 Tax=Sclerotinia sclerotiorum (strain ATCC 18683 / 1980 / Ss-1) TaxID=665079 RepID=A7ERK9_SCLS1|nr:hypothetical protein SS1G_07963 [Sclerotinia sclerotiorum 1980 UF-70]APA13432.1 hypothetical protein sscle_11g082020 [Sclerotinia sclerotiorum 1980 UF-70]EDN92101.1 hypothetical protein SS1G_07963 [Sclerotinia sclerotiorum 1980 UF-70]
MEGLHVAVNADISMDVLLRSFFAVCSIILIISLLRMRLMTASLPFEGKFMKGKSSFPVSEKIQDNAQVEEQMQLHKELYFKLQNLEDYPEVLPQSRDLLISLFSETLTGALQTPRHGILAVENYSRDAVTKFLLGEHDNTVQLWEQYLKRREAGQPMEMFRNREEAKLWLKQNAPVKYVDGAWLGHIHKVTTPFALRRTTKDTWQVLSEELGDGELDKNHVYIYRELMREIDPSLPDGDSPDFIHPRHQLNNPNVWKAALSQLLISLFPHEFLPEILGFNMHFELLTMGTMKAAKELEELKLNSYYFYLHISIDNADSGHTAMALQSVLRYVEEIRASEGEAAAQQIWKRIQAGYILSESVLNANESHGHARPVMVDVMFPSNKREEEVLDIFKAKASVAHKIHCNSKAMIGRRSLIDWLEPNAFVSKQWQMEFLNDLANSKRWVWKGHSNKSSLIRELSWKGKMFGAFTQKEVEILKDWIDSLGTPDSAMYWRFVGREATSSTQVLQNLDIAVDYPVFSQQPTASANPIYSIPSPVFALATVQFAPKPLFPTDSQPRLSVLLPLWFTHPCLLETTIATPAKTTNATSAAILRLLRAQSGFSAETAIVAGMDELRCTEQPGLMELGQELMRRHGLPEPKCLKDVLQNNTDAEFAHSMLSWAMRPVANLGLLLGLTKAFVELHVWVAGSGMLSESGALALRLIIAREEDCLDICLKELMGDEIRHGEFWKGYALGRTEIEKCF